MGEAAIESALPAAKAGRREWLGLAVLALPCLLYSMDLTVLNLAVPSLSADLRPTSAQLLWIIDLYGFLVAGALLPMGTLGDRIGRRRLLLIGAALFGVASIAAACATSAEMLIATRGLLGIAGATLAPSTLSLIRNMFHDPAQRTVAIGVWISSYSVGAAIGPLLGGLLLDHFRWGSVFLVGVPVMLLLLAVGPRLLPEFRDPNPGRLDVASAALSIAAVLPVIYGLKRVAESGWSAPAAGAIALGAAAGVAFVRRQRRLRDPLVDLALFRAPAFGLALTAYTLGTFFAFGSFVLVSQHLQLVIGLTPLQAGVWTLPFAGGFIVGSMATPALARRFERTLVMAAGSALAALGFALLALVDEQRGAPLLLLAFSLYSLGLAPVFTLSTDLIVGSAPAERAGAASALSETGSELGGALGIALLGSLGVAIYRHAIDPALPAGLLPAAADAARDTLGGALATAKEQGGELGPALTSAARSAFTASLRWVAVASAVGAAGIALLALLLRRRTAASPDDSRAPAAARSVAP